ncbi:DinB family protein [Mycolicibacterium brumae]|uniref:DinB family protein n=1 Tax=Mycolicibacterium brumae TaxID=85968 RepID=A0A2G5P4I7_9MYCO|nr:DinB family protein [Mycolicibacterium brumae]MCV7191709.1 DinB family protein [Mycolicibacterium brumae]PIB73272.1 DinB family protein [Mycolicibacterium brumae]RWA17937.1 hypothetical protein MBRU_18110 [Mycolicibacterium brumae DSM 44177]UWW08968.1 DinB family protein [Mycolicibacterium brumae]
MTQPGVEEYGEPCRECGYSWSHSFDELIALHKRVHAGFDKTVRAHTYGARIDELAWSVGEYICHVADNESIWVERFTGLPAMAEPRVAPYDQDALAAARHYPEIPFESAMGAMRRARAAFVSAAYMTPQELTFFHPEPGAITVLDALRLAIHDSHHHLWDVRRITGAASG